MAGHERSLLRGGCADAVAAVIEHEPLLPRNAVAAKPPLNLDRELLHDLARRQRRRRAEHERDRAGQVTALVRVRTPYVTEHEVFFAQVLLHPGRIDERRQGHSPATTDRSAATPGCSEQRSSQRVVDGPSSSPKRSSPRRIQGR
jgi:hypothetical protein